MLWKAILNITRITSTYVENTFRLRQECGPCGDHLHLRGEHLNDLIYLALGVGSPPLTWRTLVDGQSRGTGYRITSTYVENTILYLLVKALS